MVGCKPKTLFWSERGPSLLLIRLDNLKAVELFDIVCSAAG